VPAGRADRTLCGVVEWLAAHRARGRQNDAQNRVGGFTNSADARRWWQHTRTSSLVRGSCARALVSRRRNSLTFFGRGISPRGDAHRPLVPNTLALRALRPGRGAPAAGTASARTN
jgi:hypothetical protein